MSKQHRIQPRFGQRLRAARDKTGLTQRDLAAKAGISPVYLCQLEHGQGEPSRELVAVLSEIVGENLECDEGVLKLLRDAIAWEPKRCPTHIRNAYRKVLRTILEALGGAS